MKESSLGVTSDEGAVRDLLELANFILFIGRDDCLVSFNITAPNITFGHNPT